MDHVLPRLDTLQGTPAVESAAESVPCLQRVTQHVTPSALGAGGVSPPGRAGGGGVAVTGFVPLFAGDLPLDFPLPRVPPGAFARRLSLPRATQVHQLLRQGVRVHAPPVHPVPRGLGPLQDPPAPRQDKMLQVHLEADAAGRSRLSGLGPEAGEGRGWLFGRATRAKCLLLLTPASLPRSKRDVLDLDGHVSPSPPALPAATQPSDGEQDLTASVKRLPRIVH